MNDAEKPVCEHPVAKLRGVRVMNGTVTIKIALLCDCGQEVTLGHGWDTGRIEAGAVPATTLTVS